MHRGSRTRWLFLSLLVAWHGIGLWLFQRGFLLRRQSLDAVSPASPTAASLQRYQKAVILIVDALRFDFVVPPPGIQCPPSSVQSNSEKREEKDRNGWTLPEIPPYLCHLSVLQHPPEGSLLFHFIADPPTTTMQRLKALTTGTLPTFIDAGSNFAGTAILEDNWLDQSLRIAPRAPLVLVGDDTWTSLYPRQFDNSSCHAYPSLDVFDLHTVDAGCQLHLPTYLSTNGTEASTWRVLVAHFLGVDHCGHRYGPSHPEMHAKLVDINRFLGDHVLPSIQKDTLLFVMGDHGMDDKGDHGGDSRLEVDAALFAYAKTPPFEKEFEPLWHRIRMQLDMHGLGQSHAGAQDIRYPAIAQIDWVPTLSLLLGQPIPFGNLGAIIPQFFLYSIQGCSHTKDGCALSTLLTALRENCQQVWTYLDLYRRQPQSELDTDRIRPLEQLYQQFEVALDRWDTSSASIPVGIEAVLAGYRFLKTSLSACREIWAQFDMSLMVLGVAVLLGATVFWIVALGRNTQDEWSVSWWLLLQRGAIVAGLLCGGSSVWLEQSRVFWATAWILLGSFLWVFPALVRIPRFPKGAQTGSRLAHHLSWILVAGHALAFLSNSFVVQEVHVVFYLLQTVNLFVWLTSRIPTPHWSTHPFVLLLLTRIASTSVQCREEQLPHCESTFYQFPSLPFIFGIFGEGEHGSSAATTSVSLGASVPFLLMAMWLPRLVNRNLTIAPRTYKMFTIALFGLASHWFLEGAEPHAQLDTWYHHWIHVVRVKVWFVRMAMLMGLGMLLGGAYHRRPHALFLGVFTLCICAQTPTGIWMLALGLWQLLVVRMHLSTAEPLLAGITASLLAWQHFFATGHQATFSSIQFQTGFIGLFAFDYHLSGALVVLNTLGPALVFATGTLCVLVDNNMGDGAISGWLLHRSVTALVSTAFAGYFRRHLMVWKVFAPRFMLAGLDLILTDAIMLVAVLALLFISSSIRGCRQQQPQ